MDWNEIPLDPRHLEVPSGASKMFSEPMVRSAQTVHLSWDKISTISKRTETSFHIRDGKGLMAGFDEESHQQGNPVYDNYGEEQEDEVELDGDTGQMLWWSVH